MPTEFNQGVSFIQVVEEDFERLAALRIDAMRESLEQVGRFSPERARERLRKSFYPEHSWSVILDGQRVGFYTFRPIDTGFQLDHLYIHPSFQSKGLGSFVLRKLIAEADVLHRAIHLGALKGSRSNQFYMAHGFEKTREDEWDTYYTRACGILTKNEVQYDIEQGSQSMKYSRGSCVCAAVRYEIVAEPISLFCCHCSECQTASGASFVLALKVPYGGVTVTEGKVKPYLRPEADGQRRNVFRCPKCLAALWSERIDSSENITVYAGTLDDSAKLRPIAHIWTGDAQPWIALPKESLQFVGNPPDMRLIAEAWRQRINENQKT